MTGNRTVGAGAKFYTIKPTHWGIMNAVIGYTSIAEVLIVVIQWAGYWLSHWIAEQHSIAHITAHQAL